MSSVIRKFTQFDIKIPLNEQSFKITYENICRFLSEEILLTKENYFFNEFSEILEKAISLYIPKNLSAGLSNEELNKIKRSSFKEFAILIDSNNYASNLVQEQRILIQYNQLII